MWRPRRNEWVCAGAIVALGIVGLVLSIRAAGGGHGSYSVARVFFPYTIILGDVLGEIRLGARIIALLQYPVYGIVAGRAIGSSRHWAAALGVAAVHLAAVLGAFVVRTAVFP